MPDAGSNKIFSKHAGLKKKLVFQHQIIFLSKNLEFGKFWYPTDLSLNKNNLTGPLPPNFGSFSDFSTIGASENGLTGIPPSYIYKRGKLVFFFSKISLKERFPV